MTICEEAARLVHGTIASDVARDVAQGFEPVFEMIPGTVCSVETMGSFEVLVACECKFQGRKLRVTVEVLR